MIPSHTLHIFQSKLWRVLVKKERFPQRDSEREVDYTQPLLWVRCGKLVDNPIGMAHDRHFTILASGGQKEKRMWVKRCGGGEGLYTGIHRMCG